MKSIKKIADVLCARIYRALSNAFWRRITLGDCRWRFYNLHREEFFLKCMRFIQYNQLEGDYLEFGCYTGATFRMVHKYSRIERLNMHLYAFDSFEGLPQPKGIDVGPQWKKGKLSEPIENFENKLKASGFKKSEYTLVPGYFSETLTEDTRKKLKIKNAALVLVDCDYYDSTVPVLDFILPYLQTGTVLVLDDFYLYKGDPYCGEQLALREFLQKHPEIELVDYLYMGWHGKAFIVKKHEKA
jgi:O-methyltransferase